MKKSFFLLILFLLVAACTNTVLKDCNKFAYVTYVTDKVQERSVKCFIKSVRYLGGDYSNCNIYVVVEDMDKNSCTSLAGKNIKLIPLDMDPAFRSYPLAIKAFAAAQAEDLVKEKNSTLAWFDPATLLLNSPEDLDLKGKYVVEIRPVTLLNNIGLPAGMAPDDFWLPIFNDLQIKPENVPVVKTLVGQTEILAYFNCEIFSFDPKAGICAEWKDMLIRLLNDDEYQKNVCITPLRRLFLHQAVLSGVIISRVTFDKIKPLSIRNGYPFNQHSLLDDSIRIRLLNELNAVIFDYAWERDPAWSERIPVMSPLKEWLMETYEEY